MNVTLVEEAERTSILVEVHAAPQDSEAQRLVRRIKALDGQLSGYPNPQRPEKCLVHLDEISYICVGELTAQLHLMDGSVFEATQKLFELEQLLAGKEFLRVSRQVIINFEAIESIRPELNGRLSLTMRDGSTVLATRTYVPAIRKKLKMEA